MQLCCGGYAYIKCVFRAHTRTRVYVRTWLCLISRVLFSRAGDMSPRPSPSLRLFPSLPPRTLLILFLSPSLPSSLSLFLSLRTPACFSFRVFAYVNVYACPVLGSYVPLHMRFSIRVHVCTLTLPHVSPVSRVRRRYVAALCRKNHHERDIEIAREFCLSARSPENKWDLAAHIGDENLRDRNVVLSNG